jgi:hypothetical protein
MLSSVYCHHIDCVLIWHYRGQAEKEFRVEVEAIGHVRHKNLVRLLGYCVEGIHRSVTFTNRWLVMFVL